MSDQGPKAKQAAAPLEPQVRAEQTFPQNWFRELAGALGWNPLVGADLRPVVESCARNAEVWVAANRIALGAALAVAECQFRILRQVVDEGLSAQRDLLWSGDPAQEIPNQAWRALRGFDQLLDDLRELGNTVARSQVEVADTLNRRLTQLGDEVEQYVLRLKQ